MIDDRGDHVRCIAAATRPEPADPWDVMTSAATALSLLERDAPLSDVQALATDAAAGTGRLAVVEAGAGLGKTALLDACATWLAAHGMRVLGARGSELERDYPYAIVRQLLASARRPGEVRDAVLAGPAAAAAVLFAEARTPTDGDDADPYRIMNALYWAIANLCDLGPVAILVDDAQDADETSVRFLSFLACRLTDLPLLLLIAGRPAHVGSAGGLLGALHESPETVRIALHPLSRSAVAAVLETGLDAAPDDQFVDACWRATGGNPFYVGELVRTIAERKLPPAASSIDAVGDLGPDAIVRRLTSRLASLPAPVIPLARACAVLGEGARLPICAQLAGITLDDAASAADALVREAVLAPGRYLTFLHPILRAAVLSELGDHSGRRWHARAAQTLDEAGFPAEVVGLHLIRADPGNDPHARETLVRAGRAAARRGSPAAAAQYLTRALEESSGAPDAELLYDVGLAQASIGNQTGLAHMAAGVEATAEPRERALRAVRLANFQMRSGDLVEAVAMLERVRERIEDDHELLLTVDATRYWAGRLHPQTRDAALRLAAELRQRVIDRGVPDGPARRTLLAYLACEAAQSDSTDQATALFADALAPPGLLHFVAFDAVATQASMLSLISVERLEQFDALADRVLGEVGRRGAVLDFLVVSTFRAMAFWHRGDLAAAETESREALRVGHEQGWRHGAIGLLALDAIALIDQGEIARATKTMADAAGVFVPPGFPTALMHLARGLVSAAHGELHSGLADVLDCGRTLAAMRVESPGVIPWRSYAADLLAQLGDADESRRLAREEVELARRLAGPIALGRALHAEARSLRGAERVAVLRTAADALAGSPGHLAQAAVAIDLGIALRRERQLPEARARLTTGLELAAQCGAAPLVARARDELAILGVKVRRSPAFGPDALTPSEMRVARLAAAGRTNAEIAQQLFVTRKTVEKHLANAYRKLAIQSRSELADVSLEHNPS
jgi:DNA-binding CsgD family transcriptional regulator